MILFSIMLIGLFLFFITKKISFQRPLDSIFVTFLLICSNIILTFEVASLLDVLNNDWAILAIQAFLTVGAGVFYAFSKLQVRPAPLHLTEALKQFFTFCKQHKLFTVLLIFVVLAYLFLAYLSIIFPQNTSDSLYNHLSRIAHWLQQGSLKPYDTFSYFGITYPYNNGLLMMWSMLFIHSDRLAGLVQWIASLMSALAIYGLAIQLKFSKEQAGLSALIFLTFPLLIFESITAQNDILIAVFFLIWVYFFIGAFYASNKSLLLFSALSIALAAGTKQYLVFAVPGFLLIFLYFICKKTIPLRFILARYFVIFTLGFTFIFGSYAYVQNYIYYKNPIGNEYSGIIQNDNDTGPLTEKLAINTSRFFTQFISCEGLPLPSENQCLQIKATTFRKIFSSPAFNLEENKFMLEPNCDPSSCFSYSTNYPFNEESAWFGILSWILLLPGCIIAVVAAIRKRDFLPVCFVLTSFLYFLIISVFKAGWDEYVGRYLILSVALVMPFSGFLLANKTWLHKVFTGLFTLLAIFIMIYSILSNDSKPIVNRQMVFNWEVWGKSHSLVVEKIAYKLEPWFYIKHTAFEFSYSQNRTYFANFMNPAYDLVNKYVPATASLGIVSEPGIFLDYLFYGDHLTRKVYDFPDYSNSNVLDSKVQSENIQYLLVSPNLTVDLPKNFKPLDHSTEWYLYKRSQ